MKELQFKISFSEYQEKHTVHLGNKEWLRHKSKEFLKLYLRTYKKVMLDNVRVLNTYYAQLQQLHRMFYFDLSAIENENITNIFNDFNKSLNWIFGSTMILENSTILRKIQACTNDLFSVVEILKLHGQKHKNYSLKNQAGGFLKMLTDFESKYQENKRSLSLNRNYVKRDLKVIKEELKDIA